MINNPSRRAIVIFMDEMSFIDYDETVERSAADVTLGIDDGRRMAYFQYDLPTTLTFLDQFSYYEGPYTYEDMQTILQNSTWSGQDSALDNTLILNLTTI